LEFRRQLGLPCISNKRQSVLTILKELMKTNRRLKGMNAEDIANLPMLTDERISKGQRMLETLLTSTYLGQDITMYPLVSFQIVRASLKYGINASTCDGFAVYAFLLSIMFGDPQRGQEMARAVDLILERPGMERIKSRASFHNFGMTYIHSRSWNSSLSPLLEGYQVGLKTGDTESGLYNIMLRSWLLMAVGRPLSTVMTELTESCKLVSNTLFYVCSS